MIASEIAASPARGTRMSGKGLGTSGSTRPTSTTSGGAVYGLGMIGALVFFLGSAATGQAKVAAFGKAVVWPALLVHQAFKRLAA